MLKLSGVVGATVAPDGHGDCASAQGAVARLQGPRVAAAVDAAHCSYQATGDRMRLRVSEHHLPAPWDTAPEERSGSWLELRATGDGVEIITDRLGTIPLYYARTRTGIRFSSHLTDMALERVEPDLASIAMTVLLAHPWGQHTMLSGVALLPPASRCYLRSDGTVACERYWTPPAVNTEQPGTFEPWVEHAVERLSEAHRRHATGITPETLAMPITAGLDSRCNLALHPELAKRARLFHCHDLGSVELPYARRIARYLGRPMEVLDSAEDMRHAPEADPTLGPGDFNIGHWRLVGVARRLGTDGATATIDGFLQDLLFKATFLREAPREDLLQAQLGRARYNANALGLERERYETVAAMAEQEYPHAETGLDASQRHYLENRSRRLVYNIVRLNQNFLDVRTPALDAGLMDFGLSLPWELRRGSNLYRHIIHRLDPGLAAIPYDKSGLPLLDPRPRSRAKELSRTVRPYLDKLWPGRPFLQAPEGNFARLARRDPVFRAAATEALGKSEWLAEGLKMRQPQDILRAGSQLGQAHIDCLGGMLTVALLEQHLTGQQNGW